jgi:enediyne biosynthesis protein E4
MPLKCPSMARAVKKLRDRLPSPQRGRGAGGEGVRHGLSILSSYFRDSCSMRKDAQPARTSRSPSPRFSLQLLSLGLLAAIVVLGAQKDPLQTRSREILFQDISRKAGLNGITRFGTLQKTAVIEINGSGLCWLDYDNDGFLDLYVVNGSTLEELRSSGTAPHQGTQNYLYRNNRNRTFAEVGEKAGVSSKAWGTGCAAADYNNDGWVDLFVTNVGECRLFKNRGNGAFEDVAQQAGVKGRFDWYSGVTFGDYDNDGFLDLFVSGYLDPAQMLNPQKECNWKGHSVYCGPPGMKGAPDILYHSNGDGTFSDVTAIAGVRDKDLLFGFTATFEDFDNDGKPDLFVANDRSRNYLYHNKGAGKFEEVGELWGVAYPIEGIAQANMGVAVGDYDANGFMDILVTTFAEEHYTLFKNAGRQLFMDVSSESRIAVPTTPFLGWGTFFADLDNDSRLDLFTANGHVYPPADKIASLREKYSQRPLVFRQSAAGTFDEIGQRCLPALKTHSSRGAAYADFDNDGDLDIAYTNMDAAPTLLENVSPGSNHWLAIKTVGRTSNRDAIGARVQIKTGTRRQYATVRSGESYLSGNDPRVHFGLGPAEEAAELQVRWPSGKEQIFSKIRADQILILEEGRGISPR